MARLRRVLGSDLGTDEADPLLRMVARVVGMVLGGGNWQMGGDQWRSVSLGWLMVDVSV